MSDRVRVSHRPGFLGVLGWPLERTLSPVINGAAFEALGLPWTYLAWPVPPQELAAAVAGLRVLGAIGANVTMPHKGAVIGMLDEVSEEARRIGAVNTIARRGDALVGHNTDVAGFIAALERAGAEVAGRTVVVLGAGGAARAVVTALARMQAHEVAVCARRAHAAESVAALGAGGRPASWEERRRLAEGAEIIVNTTPLSAAGEDPLEGVRFEAEQVVVDLVYTPLETRLLGRARTEGAQVVDGLGMLLAQAAESVRIWSGIEAPIEIMRHAAGALK